MRRYHIFLFFLSIGCRVMAQPDSSFSLSRTIKANLVDFEVDNLGNVYTLSPDNRLKKINASGDSLAVYNDVRRYGSLSHIDATNPLKIILYYKEFATIVMVDRFLNVINTIDLRKLNIFQARAVGLAYDNNVWVYDELEAKLKRIGDDGTIINETTDIRQFLDVAPDPASVIDQGGLVYLYDPQNGIYIFDHYGAYQKQIPLHGITDFTVIDKNLLARNNEYFFRFSNRDINVQQLPIPSAYLPAIKIVIMPNAVYVLKQGALEIYSKK